MQRKCFQTPEMLPVLKEAGVVDSGGQGLLEVLRGAYDAFLGKEIDYSSSIKPGAAAVIRCLSRQKQILNLDIVQNLSFYRKRFTATKNVLSRNSLSSIGDSIVSCCR